MTESKGTLIARSVLGLIFTIFGLNGFLHFLPMPALEGDAGAFMGALAATGYMFPLIKGTEVVAGLLLLSGRLPALALLLLAPIVVNILAFHAILAPAGLALPLLVVGLEAYLGYRYFSVFRPLFQVSARRSSSALHTASVH